ncbi:TPA: hypothetical protein N0F65_012773 [Lagenidium giganteum]|uniref:Uncharacterized protein n=1 Tax=Lagenidium giganteum TaxID=4803 RepID=A0AAV2YGL9_9STRA|nr:TPA: hypothetical protein N0F65_012773 [Lagenidium giganteum]
MPVDDIRWTDPPTSSATALRHEPTNDEAVQTCLKEHRAQRSVTLDKDIPWSRIRAIVTLVSYALVLSDVFRAGLGISTFKNYVTVETNTYFYFGPYAYPIVHIPFNNTEDNIDLWGYKFDTTSIAMRSFAKHFNLSSWPTCINYDGDCPSDMLPYPVVFDMLDSLIAAVTKLPIPRVGHSHPKTLSLRMEYNWFDRFHHYLLPQFFAVTWKRTVQALHYPASLLRQYRTSNLCGASKVHPYACDDFWYNYKRVCPPAKAKCVRIGTIWNSLFARMAALRALYPNMEVDLTIFEGSDDVSHSSMSYQGGKSIDLVTLVRVRNCSSADSVIPNAEDMCTTVAVDDYRYEGTLATTDLPQWYSIVATLRVIGQVYIWARLTALFVGTYKTRSAASASQASGILPRVLDTVRTVLSVPSQVIVYGSLFPVGCYATAHLIDSPMVYELVSQKFTTPLGVLSIDMKDFFRTSAIQMRNVWVLGILLHAIVIIWTNRSWSPHRGVLGVPEFLISVMSAATIFSQYRLVTYRNTKVFNVHEFPDSHHRQSIRTFTFPKENSFVSMVLRGQTLDLKNFSCMTVVIIGAAIGFSILLRGFTRTSRFQVCSRSLVPYSAGHLWATHALVISWNGGFAWSMPAPVKNGQVKPISDINTASVSQSVLTTGQRIRNWLRHVLEYETLFVVDESLASLRLQHQMSRPSDRTNEVNSVVYLMNLAAMTDPITWLYLRFFSRARVAFYRCHHTGALLMLPEDAVTGYENNDLGDTKVPDQAIREHRAQRTAIIERDIPWSWIRVLVTLVSYALVLSDVFRAGLGVATFSSYVTVETNTFFYFGPYAYPIVHIPSNNTEDTTDLWSYKFDTTSIATRSFAKYFNLASWPACVNYDGDCPSDTLPFAVAFDMLDSLVTAVARLPTRRVGGSTDRPKTLSLRMQYQWYDRFHNYLLPQFFAVTWKRTVQALHYPPSLLRQFRTSNLCSVSKTRPYVCNDFWYNYKRVCPPSDDSCVNVGTIWKDVSARMAALRTAYPNMEVDLTIIEGTDDNPRSSISHQATKSIDLITLMRVRNCSNVDVSAVEPDDMCTTVAVDDYRYEGALVTTDLPQWYCIVAKLRFVGQFYMWVRLLALFVGIYKARSTEPSFKSSGVLRRLFGTVRAVLTVPSKVIVYGSLFPVACYVTAHLIDSPMVYELVSEQFTTPLGVLRIDMNEFFYISAIQMRNVWVLGLLVHAITIVWTHRSWSPDRGVLGMPKFLVSAMSAATIFSQYRLKSYRNTKVLSVHEFTESHARQAIRTFTYGSCSVLSTVIGGQTLDFKNFLCLTLVIIGATIVLSILLRVFSKTRRFQIFSRSIVPYSAGRLWFTNALVVSWNGGYTFRVPSNRVTPFFDDGIDSVSQIVLVTKKPIWQRFLAWLRRVCQNETPLVVDESLESLTLQRQMSYESERTNHVSSVVYLMNLAAMTDPITWLYLHFFSRVRVAFYRCHRTDMLLMLPEDVVKGAGNNGLGWEDVTLVATVPVHNLAWSDLVHCG